MEQQGLLTAWLRRSSITPQVLSTNSVLSLGIGKGHSDTSAKQKLGVPVILDCSAARITPTCQREGEDGQGFVTSLLITGGGLPWHVVCFVVFFFIGAEFQTRSEWNQKLLADLWIFIWRCNFSTSQYFSFFHIFLQHLQWQMQFLLKGNASRTFSLSSKGLTHNYTWKDTQEIIRGAAGSQNQTDLCVVCDIWQHETRSLAYGHSGKTRGASYGNTLSLQSSHFCCSVLGFFFISSSGLQWENPNLPWLVLTKALLRDMHRWESHCFQG